MKKKSVGNEKLMSWLYFAYYEGNVLIKMTILQRNILVYKWTCFIHANEYFSCSDNALEMINFHNLFLPLTSKIVNSTSYMRQWVIFCQVKKFVHLKKIIDFQWLKFNCLQDKITLLLKQGTILKIWLFLSKEEKFE